MVDDTRTPEPSDEEAADSSLFRVVERAKQEWEATFDAIADGIAVVSPDGTIQRANRALAQMFERSVRDLPGTSCCELLPHHVDHGCPADAVAMSSRSFERFDDDYRCFEETIHPRPNGVGAILIVGDVTRQTLVLERMKKLHEETRRSNRALNDGMDRLRETQQQLIAAEKIASIAALAAGLAHEVNNPLGIVASNLDHLERHAGSLLRLVDTLAALVAPDRAAAVGAALEAADLDYVRSDLADVAADAREGTDRIRRIVAAIADFAAGDGTEATPIPVAAVVGDALIDARARLDAAEIPDPVLGRHADDVRVLATRRQLHQVLSRLLDNAVEAGGELTAVAVRVEPLPDSGGVTIDIEDSGTGVDPATARHAAVPFFSTRTQGAHLGLGFTIAAAISSRLGGHLTLTSRTDGRGARARLTLPVADRSADQDPRTMEMVAGFTDLPSEPHS